MRRGVVIYFLGLFLLAAPLASADQHPAGCSQAAFTFDWGPGLDVIHRNGDVVATTAKVGNNGVIGTGICDVTDATVTLQFPNSDGTSGGPLFTLATNVDFPAGSAPKSFATKKLTLGFDPGVFRGPVTIAVTGVWHVSEPDTDPVTQELVSLGCHLTAPRDFQCLADDFPRSSVHRQVRLQRRERQPRKIRRERSATPRPPSFDVMRVGRPLLAADLHRRRHDDLRPLVHSIRAKRGRTSCTGHSRPARSSTLQRSPAQAAGTAAPGQNEQFAWRGAGASSRTSSVPTRRTC